jgi:hypothetical protein
MSPLSRRKFSPSRTEQAILQRIRSEKMISRIDGGTEEFRLCSKTEELMVAGDVEKFVAVIGWTIQGG